MFSVDSSPSSSCHSSPRSNFSSPGSNQASPGVSGQMGALTVRDQNTEARKKLFTDESDGDVVDLKTLEDSKKRLRESMNKPLIAKKGDHANEVFAIDLSPKKQKPVAVFKLGEVNAKKAILCSQVAELLGLDKTVPCTIAAQAAQVVCKDDLNDESEPIMYRKVECNGQPWLADPDACFKIHTHNKTSVQFKGGYDFSLEAEDDGFTLVPRNDKSENHALANEQVRLVSLDGVMHAVRYESAHPITVDEKGTVPFVLRGDQRLTLKSSLGPEPMSGSDGDDDDVFECSSTSRTVSHEDMGVPDDVFLVGEGVTGLLQRWVRHEPANIGSQPEAREQFFARVTTCSLINAVVLSCLFNTEDGKVSLRGDDSNFLFCKEGDDGSLGITMIDLDETWPETNTVKADGKISSLRLGLLGFQKVHQKLEGQDKAHLLNLVQRIRENQLRLVSKLQECGLPNGDKVAMAFASRLHLITTFEANECSLADFVFHVFPTYKAQFLHLLQAGLELEYVADHVGFASVDEVMEQIRARNHRK